MTEDQAEIRTMGVPSELPRLFEKVVHSRQGIYTPEGRAIRWAGDRLEFLDAERARLVEQRDQWKARCMWMIKAELAKYYTVPPDLQPDPVGSYIALIDGAIKEAGDIA